MGDGIRGVRLRKQIMQVAGDALKQNISTLGPLVLPISEQLRFVANMVARRAIRGEVPLPGPLRKTVQSLACWLYSGLAFVESSALRSRTGPMLL